MPKHAVILAGGFGTRLHGVVGDRPKVLAHAGGQPFLDYLLRFLANEGINDIVLSTGFLADQVSQFAGDGGRWGLRVHYSQEEYPLGTGGALRRACWQFGLRTFFALNGDTLFLISLEELWRRHLLLRQSLPIKGTVALRLILPEEANARGCVRLANDGKIVVFDEKPTLTDKTMPGQSLLSSAGVYILQEAALAEIAPGQKASLERQVFPRLARQGQLAGHVYDGYFADIGTPDSLARFEEDLKSKVVRLSGL